MIKIRLLESIDNYVNYVVSAYRGLNTDVIHAYYTSFINYLDRVHYNEHV